MHESGLMRGVISDLEALARTHDSKRIVGVVLQIRDRGDFPGEHFVEHLQALAVGTVIEGAHIKVEMLRDPDHLGSPAITIQRIEVPS